MIIREQESKQLGYFLALQSSVGLVYTFILDHGKLNAVGLIGRLIILLPFCFSV